MELKILKENEEGYGIIIDHESGLITKDFNQKFINEGLIKEQTDLSQPIIYYATLQKYGVENRNGRVYPENILKREVDKYKTVINRNASFHELDHPSECCDFETEILTVSGWKYLKDISEHETIFTLNTETNIIEVHQIFKKIDEPYNGLMLKMISKNFDMLVTPNHKFWVVNKNDLSGKFVTAQEIKNKEIDNFSDYFIPSTSAYILDVDNEHIIWLDSIDITEQSYNDRIYCVEVNNHTFYARRNGKSTWTGNSTISLKGGSPHRILELFWQGNSLIGKLELLVSDGYRKNGIISCNGDLVAMYLSYGMTLGISSRGVGSLKKVDGKNVVQEDFELICWDIVSSPSTPGSYLYKEVDEFSKYDEDSPMVDVSNNKEPKSEFLSRLNNFLNK